MKRSAPMTCSAMAPTRRKPTSRQRAVRAEEARLWDRMAREIGCIVFRVAARPANDYVSIQHIDGRTKPGRQLVLPLCAGHHQAGTGEDKSLVAVHPNKARFEALYGSQRELLAIWADFADTVAENDMMGRVFDADDKVKASMDEARRQKALADNAERTLAAKSHDYIERARNVSYWKNRAEKAERAWERPPDMLPAIAYVNTRFPEPRPFQRSARRLLRAAFAGGHRCHLVMSPTSPNPVRHCKLRTG